MTGPNLPLAQSLHPGKPPSPAIVIFARVLAFVTLAVAAAWALVLTGISMLSIMWGPPCTSNQQCGTTFWPAIGISLAGCAGTLLILVIALPLAWRRQSLIIWVLVGVLVGVGALAWASAHLKL